MQQKKEQYENSFWIKIHYFLIKHFYGKFENNNTADKCTTVVLLGFADS